jgi:hypothetical protein
MKNNRILLWIIIIAAIIGVFFLFYMLIKQAIDRNEVDWRETYSLGQEPYGIWLFKSLVENDTKIGQFNTVNQPLKRYLPIKARDSKKETYLFIGSKLYLSDSSISALTSFIAKGNDAVIIAKDFPVELINGMYNQSCGYWSSNADLSDTLVHFNFTHPSLMDTKGYTFKQFYNPKKMPPNQKNYNWRSFDGQYFCDNLSGVQPIGTVKTATNSERYNFIRIPYQEGNLYLHITPYAFTNYHLSTSAGFHYAKKVLSHVSLDEVHWDTYNNNEWVDSNQSQQNESNGRDIMYFIFKHSSLTYAWYMVLGGFALALLFYSKRRQRIMDIPEWKENLSLEFQKTVGRLYFAQNNHKKLLQLEYRLLQNFIRQKYMINTALPQENRISLLALKSKLNASFIEELITQAERYALPHAQVKEEHLMNWTKLLRHFYQNCA